MCLVARWSWIFSARKHSVHRPHLLASGMKLFAIPCLASAGHADWVVPVLTKAIKMWLLPRKKVCMRS